MISTAEQLENRGFLGDPEYKKIIERNIQSVDSMLNSKKAAERTAAIRFIRDKRDFSYIKKLTEQLKTENKLYTKIELCECLSDFGIQSIPYLIPLLGKIGKNQHKKVAEIDLKKKSFPLPRDVVARILIRIGPETFQKLNDALDAGDRISMSESIDAIGHITFNYKDYSMENELIKIFEQNNDELIKWKLVRSFQSFNSSRIKEILKNIQQDYKENEIIKKEAKRSLLRIEERNFV